MTVVIADLVARIRADTTDVKAGTAQAAEGLQSVEAQARQTAAALDIMAAQFAKLHGGTAVDALKMFQSAGVQPTAAALDQAAKSADSLGSSSQRAATGFQQTAAAAREAASAAATFQGIARRLDDIGVVASGGQVSSILAAQQHAQQQQAVSRALQEAGVSANVAAQQAKALTTETQSVLGPSQAAARASEDVSKGWSAADSNVVRFGTSLVGVGLGISVVAGAARLIHEAITAVVTSQLDWERSLVQVNALYGAIGPQVLATAQLQAAAPGLAGSAQDFTQAALNARFLSSRYGLPQSDITTLTSAAGRAAGTLNLEPGATQAAFLQAIESGGSGLRNITGTELDPLSVSRRLGGTSEAQLQALTPAQIYEVRTQAAAQDAARLAIAGNQDRPGLFQIQTEAQKRLTEAQTNLANALEGGSPINTVAAAAEQQYVSDQSMDRFAYTRREIQAQQGVSTEPIVERPPVDPALTKAVEDAQAAFEASAKAIGDNQKALDDSTAALAKLGVEAGTATFRLLGFTGSLEDRASIARLDVSAQAQSAVASRAVGPNPLIYQSPAEIAAQAAEKASQDALKAYVAPQAQQALQQNQAIRNDLSSRANAQGPGLEPERAAAQAALDDLDRRTAAETGRLNAQQAGAYAARAQAEAQSQLTAITLQQDERRLSVAEQLAGYRSESLQLEGQLAPLLLQQATLQDRMTVAARDNLTSRRELIAAEQQQLSVTQVTSQYDYEQERLKLRAQQSLGSILAGQGPTEDIGNLQEQYFRSRIERAQSGVDIQALDAGRQVQVTQQQRTGEDLARQGPLIDLEAQARALDDQTRPVAALLRDAQAREQSLQRQLALLDLQDTRAITTAQHQLNAASQLALKAAEAERAAADLAANQDLGATAADRYASAMSRGYSAVNDTAVALSSVRDMLSNMPALVVPTTAADAANGGARVPGSEFSIPTNLTPFPKYDPSRAIDTLPGTQAAPPTVPGSEFSIPTFFPPPVPQAVLERPSVASSQAGAEAQINVPLIINGQTPQQVKDQVHQAVEDALNRFFAGASTAGSPAPGSVAGNGR